MEQLSDNISNLAVENSEIKSLCKVLTIYVDGSCINNGKINAIAGIGIWVQDYPQKNVSKLIGKEYNQTNQIAELLAVQEALDIVTTEKKVIIYTDSMYVSNAINSWYEKWKANNWKKADGNTPFNLTFIKCIMETIRSLQSQDCEVNVVHIKGHSRNVGNENANTLAVAATRQGYSIEEKVSTVKEEVSQSKHVPSTDIKDRINRCIDELLAIRDSL